MTRQVFEFSNPDRFVVGTVGMPGERTFYLQARSGSQVTSVACEKEQAAALAERVDQILDEVRDTRASGAQVPNTAPPALADPAPLDLPLIEEFRVGVITLGWDDSSSRVVIEAHASSEDEHEVPELGDDDASGPDTLRIWLQPAYARAFAERARNIVAAGRQPCPFCNQPLDPQGHVCPRANGYRRRG